MGNFVATARHGAHKDNVLTPLGKEEVDVSARWLLDRCKKDGITTVNLVTSTEPRAINSGARYQAILVEGGLTVNVHDPDARLNLAGGVGAIAKGDAEKGIPPYGQGFIKWWANQSAKSALPEGGVEPFDSVAERVTEVLDERDTDERTELLLAVFHGGSIEPGLAEFLVLNNNMDDLPSGALVLSDLRKMSYTYEVFNPADGSVISGD